MWLIFFSSVLLHLFPKQLDESAARRHSDAATVAAVETGLDVLLVEQGASFRGIHLLTAMAYRESRFLSEVVSRMQCSGGTCVRVASIWRSRVKPRGARGTYYCGVLQVGGGRIDWPECLRLIDDVGANYRTSAEHLVRWAHDPHCRKLQGVRRLTCALRGYGGGYRAIKNKNAAYSSAVLQAAAWISSEEKKMRLEGLKQEERMRFVEDTLTEVGVDRIRPVGRRVCVRTETPDTKIGDLYLPEIATRFYTRRATIVRALVVAVSTSSGLKPGEVVRVPRLEFSRLLDIKDGSKVGFIPEAQVLFRETSGS